MSDRNNPKHWFDQIDEVHKAKNTEEFYVLAEGLANYIAQVTEDNEKAQEKLTQYEAVEQMEHIAIYAPISFCEARGCGYGNRHKDEWMLSVGTPGDKWKYKVHYYDSFAELVEALMEVKS